tara:strand:+ start:2646 stop:2996 length:351 start_codon:yes stop_codon:yes gene_type:complete
MKKENHMMNFFYISIGAVPAAILRWKIEKILIVNSLGCFILGFIHALSIPKKYKLIFGFAFCGSMTTFSGWIFNLFEYLSNGFYIYFALDFVLTIGISFFAICFGNLLARKIKILS